MGYLIDKKKYKEFINYALRTGFHDKKSAEEHFEHLITLFNNLPDPIKLYRLVFLKSMKDFRKNEPGSHYVLSKKKLMDDKFDKFLYDYSEFEEPKPYIVTALVPKNNIDYDITLSNNLAYPQEEEITLKDKGMGIKIISIEELTR